MRKKFNQTDQTFLMFAFGKNSLQDICSRDWWLHFRRKTSNARAMAALAALR